MTEQERLRQLEDRLWKAADQLRANSSLAASQYSIPVLGLIFLRYADVRFTQVERELAGRAPAAGRSARPTTKPAVSCTCPRPPASAYLRDLPEGSDLGQAINRAMEAIEDENPDLKGVLPRTTPASTTRCSPSCCG